MRKVKKKLTSFVTQNGQWQFKRMSFGLKNATATLYRIMKIILQKHTSYARFFVDIIIIFSESYEKHLEHVKAIIDELRRVECFGYKIGNGVY